MDLRDQISKIIRGTSEIISVDLLEKKLKEKKVLRVKAGFDPTAPDIHLGHVVLLRKLRQFQDCGHTIDFLVGDFTALIGDPTGRNKLRPSLDADYIKKNAQTYTSQAFKILDQDKTNVVYNSQWLGALSSQDMMSLTAYATVGQMLARSDFKKRFEGETEISVMEFIYPLLQGFDSYFLASDVELGGTDQKFNLLMGRQMQAALMNAGFEELIKPIYKKIFNEDFVAQKQSQVVIMTPLLEGTDGVKKMSKSLGNYIGINEKPDDIFGKIMSISDELMKKYYEFLTDIELEDIPEHPKDAKMLLAGNIVAQFYDQAIADSARQSFDNVFAQGNVPQDILEVALSDYTGKDIIAILVETKLVASKNEARRLLSQGAVSFDGNKLSGEDWVAECGVLKVGKRRFLKLV